MNYSSNLIKLVKLSQTLSNSLKLSQTLLNSLKQFANIWPTLGRLDVANFDEFCGLKNRNFHGILLEVREIAGHRRKSLHFAGVSRIFNFEMFCKIGGKKGN